MKPIYKACIAAAAAAFASAAVAAVAQSSMAGREDVAQLKADKAALHRQIKRLEADESRLKSDTASGRMTAESKDAYAVYQGRQAVKGEEKDIAADQAASLQMKSDKAALHRQIKGLEVAEARLKADKAEGKMAAESEDSERVYKDRLAVKSEMRDIAGDKANLKSDQPK